MTPAEFCAKPVMMSKGTTQRLLTALGEGWVKLEGPPLPSDAPIGADDDSNDSGDETATRTTVVSGTAIKRKKVWEKAASRQLTKTKTKKISKKGKHSKYKAKKRRLDASSPTASESAATTPEASESAATTPEESSVSEESTAELSDIELDVDCDSVVGDEDD